MRTDDTIYFRGELLESKDLNGVWIAVPADADSELLRLANWSLLGRRAPLVFTSDVDLLAAVERNYEVDLQPDKPNAAAGDGPEAPRLRGTFGADEKLSSVTSDQIVEDGRGGTIELRSTVKMVARPPSEPVLPILDDEQVRSLADLRVEHIVPTSTFLDVDCRTSAPSPTMAPTADIVACLFDPLAKDAADGKAPSKWSIERWLALHPLTDPLGLDPPTLIGGSCAAP